MNISIIFQFLILGIKYLLDHIIPNCCKRRPFFMNPLICPHYLQIILFNTFANRFSRLLKTSNITRRSLVITSCIHIFWTIIQLLEKRIPIMVNVLYIRVSSTYVVHKVAPQIITLMHWSQILKSLVQGLRRDDKVLKQKRSNNFHFDSVDSN